MTVSDCQSSIHLDPLPALGALLLFVPQDAWAYLDPGQGSLLIQYAAAGLFSALFLLRTQWAIWSARWSKKPATDTRTD